MFTDQLQGDSYCAKNWGPNNTDCRGRFAPGDWNPRVALTSLACALYMCCFTVATRGVMDYVSVCHLDPGT
jgi:hypothetical protein